MLLEVVSSLLSKGLEVGKSLGPCKVARASFGPCKVARASFLAAGGLGLVLRLHRRATTQPSHRGCDNRALLVVVAVLKEGIHGIEWEDLKTCVKVLCYSMISKGAVHCISSEDAGEILTREARKVVIDLSDGLIECIPLQRGRPSPIENPRLRSWDPTTNTRDAVIRPLLRGLLDVLYLQAGT